MTSNYRSLLRRDKEAERAQQEELSKACKKGYQTQVSTKVAPESASYISKVELILKGTGTARDIEWVQVYKLETSRHGKEDGPARRYKIKNGRPVQALHADHYSGERGVTQRYVPKAFELPVLPEDVCDNVEDLKRQAPDIADKIEACMELMIIGE